MESAERKLAAILAMDVVDYSAKMSEDEQVTLRNLKECRKIIEDVVSSQKGRIFNTAGDAFMIEFASPVNALDSAIEIQKKIKERNYKVAQNEHLEFRMGVNMGDIMIEGENLFGEGVNIAARLEGIAPEGGICASEMVYSMAKGKVDAVFNDQGVKNLKNIDDPVRVYFVDENIAGSKKRPRKTDSSWTSFNINWAIAAAIILGGVAFWVFNGTQVAVDKVATPSELNTLVVVPLENVGGDADQETFAMGLSQELATGLTRGTYGLNIIGLSNIPEDLKTLSEELGADYLLSGSLRSSTEQFRVTVKLIDAKSLGAIWTDTYDKNKSAKNIFEIQDAVVEDVLDTLVGNGAVLSSDLISRNQSKGTDNLSAYECVTFTKVVFLKSLSVSDFEQAMSCLKEAVISDPKYADAWARLGWLYTIAHAFGFKQNDSLRTDALLALDRAIAIDPGNAYAFTQRAEAAFHSDKWKAMFEDGEKALKLAPNDASVLTQVGYQHLWGGTCTTEQIMDVDAKYGKYTTGGCRWQKAVPILQKAFALDKANLEAGDNYGLWWVYWAKGEYEKALQVVQMLSQPNWVWWHMLQGLAHHKLKNDYAATESFNNVNEIIGDRNINNIFNLYTHWQVEVYWPLHEKIFQEYNFK